MYRIGIDLGGTNIAAGLVGEDFEILVKDSLPTQATRPAEQIVDDIALLCRRVCDAAGVLTSDVGAVGIASPGVANHDTGVVEYANNLPFRHFPIAQLLRERFPVERVSVENDANAAAWGEAVAGAARGTDNSVMITLGTGVGGGIIIDHKVYSGSNFAGAELGHIVIQQGGRQCSCGRRGCWEAYSSATAMIRMTQEKLEECAAAGRDTLMSELVAQRGRVTGRTACDAMRMGDAAALEVYNEYIKYLACGLTNIVNIFQPQVISLGGGISGEGQSLVDAVSPLVHAEQYGSGIVNLADIRIAKLGNDAGIIGAAFLGI
ncbi:MAG: ROK family protein [Eubacteriales bacterium]|nr:ROK family protein [Eubacteriales bacterium]MDY4898092.1 ROK family protein [Eubacteriales bacterium]